MSENQWSGAKRFHPGAPLKSTYVKLPSRAQCADCEFDATATGATDDALRDLRRDARDHAAVEHHRVVIHLAQDVVMEPKFARTREKAIAP